MKTKILTLLLIGTLFLVGYAYAAPIWSDRISKEFEVTTPVPVCDRESWIWKKWDVTSGELKQWDSLTSCYEEDGVPPICCPTGYECAYDIDPSDPNYMHCVAVTYVLNYCEDYTIAVFGSEDTTKAECKSAPPKVAANSVGRVKDFPAGVCNEGYREINKSNKNCFRYASCLCNWYDPDPLDGVPGSCNPSVENSKWYCDNPGDDDDDEIDDGTDGTCILEKSGIEGDCKESDYITITWQKIWKPVTVGAAAPAECTGSKSRSIACPSRLIFFTIFSFAAAVAITIFVYVLKFSRKKRGN